MAYNFGLGDMVWSCIELRNDGSIPEMPEDALIASAGARGVIVKVGTLEEKEDISVYLVRFEDAEGTLGAPIGCLTEELTQDEQLASSLANGVSASADTEKNAAQQPGV